MIGCGMRRGEVAGLTVADFDLDNNTAYVMGKGARPRVCAFGRKTAAAVDRYLRERAKHRHARRAELWLTHKGALNPESLPEILSHRARQAGIDHLHPHMLRHSFAHQWLSGGGQEQDLMRLGGWRSRTVMARYGAATADERARDAHRCLSPEDRL
jgi:site-specific recombinase XerD